MKIDLRRFIQVDQIETPVPLPADALALIGEPLKFWLDQLLSNFGVVDQPIIQGHVAEGATLTGRIFVARGATIEPGAMITGPCYIGENATIRHSAYIRGQVYVGKKAIVGHTTEVKGAMLLPDAKAAHFAYVADSILGIGVNLGAGTKLANLPLHRRVVRFRDPDTGNRHDSGLRKFGAILGDGAQTGCNAVLSPGTLLGPDTAVMPCTHYVGTMMEGIAR